MSPISQIKILIVDDEEDILEILENAFQMFGFQVKTALSGNKAIEILKSYPADTVISDIRMPDGDGLVLLDYIKSKNVHSPTVFFLSGFTDHPQDKLFHLGIDGFFSKPFNASEIRTTLEKSQKETKNRWIEKHVHLEPVLDLEFSVDSLSPQSKDPNFQMGRGGFFFATEQTLPLSPLDLIRFQITILDKRPCSKIIGVGQVRWTRTEPSSMGPKGVGIEIYNLDSSCIEDFCQWHSNIDIRPYIPSSTI
ncbi:MAG: response regulator [Bdellovibrionales bacterium]|nr:response regulator [Bdellovibrionales bacterium]